MKKSFLEYLEEEEQNDATGLNQMQQLEPRFEI